MQLFFPCTGRHAIFVEDYVKLSYIANEGEHNT